MVTRPSAGSAKDELGLFLRKRRERLTPAQVGLPAGGRRRTPGLRREEVAALAGVGVTWYTWLEQGRDINASGEVLDAVAAALRLDPDERHHLWRLAKGAPAPVDPAAPSCQVLTQDHLDLLAGFSPVPACIQNGRFDLLAYNAPYRFLIDDLDRVDWADRSCLVQAFTNPAWRAAYEDPEDVVVRMVGRLRAGLAEHLDDPAWTGLVARLRRESPAFERLWGSGAVGHDRTYPQTFKAARPGRVDVRFVPLWLDRVRSVQIKLLQPADADSRARFEAFAATLADPTAITLRPGVGDR